MEAVSLTILGVVLLGCIIQTFHIFPTFFDSYFDETATKLTVGGLLLVASAGLLMVFLQSLQRLNREGFANEEPKAMSQWKSIVQTYPIKDVCAIKQLIEEKLIAVEKGTSKLTDTQAKERVAKVFGTPLDCNSIETVSKAKDIDSFFTAIQLVPNTLLIQTQETAIRCRLLLQKQYDDVMKSLEKKEGFVDPSVGICSPKITEERRKFLRQKKLDEAAERCLLPEEVPFEKKETVAMAKVKKIQDTYDAYLRMKPKQPLLSDLVVQSQDLLKRLEEKKREAESGKLFK